MTEQANNFCSACGKPLINTAVICPNCGSPTSKYFIQNHTIVKKSKVTAVLLAVFLGFWSFLYTYRVDKAKFWISLSLISIIFFTDILIFTVTLMYEPNYLQDYSGRGITIFTLVKWILWTSLLGSWLWSVIAQSCRSIHFFEKYTN